jgi:glycosyltransferase involved in cell wall biosynthesis
MRVAYLTGRYPGITHTFILREVRALRRLGIDVHCFSIWRTAQQELLSPADIEEWQATDALLPLSATRVLRSHLRAVWYSPRAYFATLARAVALSWPGARSRALGLTWFLESMMLWEACRARGIRHVHAQLQGTAPMVAMLAVGFANSRLSEAERWSFSQTVHGSKEFYDVHRERFDVRVAAASFTACISDYTRSQVMAFVPEELWHKLVVVRCGVDLEEFAPRQREPSADLRILTVGRVDAMKGTAVLLQAFARLVAQGVSATLTIVGDGPSASKLAATADRLGIADRVRWQGAVGQDRIRDFYAECDVFCLPSFAEGVPIVLMEAMAMEIPVLANAITGIVELVEDEVSGFLVRPGRVDQLADRLEQLASDAELRAAMGRAGRSRIAREYDLDANASFLARVFREGPPVAPVPEPVAIGSVPGDRQVS